MLTHRTQTITWDEDERVVKLQEDEFGRYHLRKFYNFQETLHKVLDTKEFDEALNEYIKEMN